MIRFLYQVDEEFYYTCQDDFHMIDNIQSWIQTIFMIKSFIPPCYPCYDLIIHSFLLLLPECYRCYPMTVTPEIMIKKIFENYYFCFNIIMF